MNQLQTFSHELFGELNVRSFINDKGLFNLNDVAWSLGYIRNNANGVAYLRHDRIKNILERLDISTCDHDGHKYIDESGLYDFVFEAGTDRARGFRKWVTNEVLPSIRKHGAYATPQTIENIINDPEFGIELLQTLKSERDHRMAAESAKEKISAQMKQDAPYTSFGKVVSNSDASINIGSFSKMLYDKHGIRMGRNKMFEWLREQGYLIKTGRERNNPKQQYIEQGLFDVRPTIVSRSAGDVEKITTLITGKGQVQLTKKLLQEFGMNKEVI
jgi:anti-repressor protein